MTIDVKGHNIKISPADRLFFTNHNLFVLNSAGAFTVRMAYHGKYHHAAKLLLGGKPWERVFYKDGDWKNLERDNLELCSRSEFQSRVNRRIASLGMSGYRGIWFTVGAYRGSVCRGGVRYHVPGRFDTPKEAYEAREKFMKERGFV